VGVAQVSEHEHTEPERRTTEEVAEEQEADAVEDLEVPQGQQEDVGGGVWDWYLK
jgi:hypothetical protein